MNVRKTKILLGVEATGGGTLKHIVYLAGGINRDMFDLTIAVSLRNNEPIKNLSILEALNVEIVKIRMENIANPFFCIFSLVRVYNLIGRNRFDVVHSHSSKAGGLFRIAAWLRRVPMIIHTPHCFHFQGRQGFSLFLFRAAERFLALVSDYLVVSTIEKEISIRHKIAPIDKLIKINNAINPEDYTHYDPRLIRARLGISETQSVVSAVGRLVDQKDWHNYIRAAAETLRVYPDTIFFVVGSGRMYNEIKQLVNSLDYENRIIVLGHVEEIGEILSITNIFVNASKREGLPYVILEAMLFKLPIISTYDVRNGLIIQDINGILISVGDDKGLCKNILRLINSPSLRKELGENAHHTLTKSCSFGKFIKRHEDLYRRTR